MAYDGKKQNRLAESGYESKYPFNQVTLYEGGHEVHFDNTEGKERIRYVHGPSGTYWEINPDGAKVEMTVGHSQAYHKGGMTLTVDENGDIGIRGHKRENVHGGEHSTHKGDHATVVGGDATSVTGGSHKQATAGDSYHGVKGSQNINVMGHVSWKIGGNITIEATGNMTLKGATISMNP